MARRSPQTRPLGAHKVEHAPALYRHIAHPHQPRNVNETHHAERAAKAERPGLRGRIAAFNLWLASHITLVVGTMWCAYVFTLLAATGFPGVHAPLHEIVQWFSQTFLQLVFLPVLAVGGAVLNRHAELQSDAQYHATLRELHESDQMMRHLDAQDAELLRQTAELQRQTDMILRIAAKLALENVAATTPAETKAVSLAAPDTRTADRHSDAAATSPASPPSPAPVVASRAPRPAPHAAKAPHAASPANSSASTHSRRGAPASGQRRPGYQTSSR